MKREDISAKAMELVTARVRFRPYGREPFADKRTRGLDCVGVVIWVGEQLGLLKDAHLPPYSFPPQGSVFDLFNVYSDEIQEPREGAIVIFRDRDGTPLHCGILARNTVGWSWIGISPTLTRPYVTACPFDEGASNVWKFYDYKGIE